MGSWVHGSMGPWVHGFMGPRAAILHGRWSECFGPGGAAVRVLEQLSGVWWVLGLAIAIVPLGAQTPAPPSGPPTIEKKSPALDALIDTNATFEKLGTASRGRKVRSGAGRAGSSSSPTSRTTSSSAGRKARASGVPAAVRLQRQRAVHGPRAWQQRADLRLQRPPRDLPARRAAGSRAWRRTGRLTNLADKFDGKRLNSPNDLVYNSTGDLYFTDPPYGLPKSFDDQEKELPFQGVYRVNADGS